jgi:chitinase
MVRSARQAAANLQRHHGVPPERIALTAMVGENDVAGNVLDERDAAALATMARELGLAGLHHWSLDRDRPCDAGSPRVSPRCHGLPGVPAGRFGALLDLAR